MMSEKCVIQNRNDKDRDVLEGKKIHDKAEMTNNLGQI
jgi:hypothetical protein